MSKTSNVFDVFLIIMERVKKITGSSSSSNFYKKRYYTIEEDY